LPRQRPRLDRFTLTVMLLELHIENYAVIDRLRVRFHAGLNLLTGETGSGKSIVVDALALLFGDRASAEVVRSGADRARIGGIFEVREVPPELGIETEDGELLIEREVLSNGKSRAFVASRPVAASLLKDLGAALGEIHGQHDQGRFFEAASQLELLDAFAGNERLTAETAGLYRAWRDCGREIDELDRSEQEKLRLADLWNFQHKEIESAALKPGEDVELEDEKRVLQNVTRLQDAVNAAYSALAEGAAAPIRTAMKRLEEASRFDAALMEPVELLRPADIAVDESTRILRDYLSRLEADPQRLDAIETRLAAIDKLKRKYGASVSEILAFAEDVRAKLDAIETAGERRQALRKREADLAAEYERTATALTKRRTEAAQKLQKQVENELKSLAMERTVFRIQISEAAWSPSGRDAVRFLVSPNAGEEPKPLDRIASGGELSRIALAIKTCIAPAASEGRTLVFDEVDAGVGGRAGEAVGRRLKTLAATHQVLCVTHLPQIACFADHHYSVEKRSVKGRTVAQLAELDSAGRTREIGRMLSGAELTEEALRHAEQLIRMGAS
jgi:DNA repair protein RecN (Recombination protein N)